MTFTDRIRLLSFALLAIVLQSACAQSPTSALAAGGIHVLFIGNSLTYTNDLPAVLTAIAASGGDTIRTSIVAQPDFALIDHLATGDAARAIGQDHWRYVVLQQGPSTLPANRDSLVIWSKAFAPLIRAQGATPALFMVWPDASRTAYFEDCRQSYFAANEAIGGVFLPAGEAWVHAWDANPALVFYAADGVHPSPLGTYVAALVMYERFTGRDARLLPAQPGTAGAYNGVPPAVDSTTLRLLQRAVHDVDQRYPAGSR